MPKGDSISTIKKILSVAEDLFAEKGFNGTSVSMIAKKAGVNKALIYYHFKDKNDIINSLFKNIIMESEEYISHSDNTNLQQNKKMSVQDMIREEITFMLKRKKILSIMLMESLKGDDKENYFFQFAENVIKNELDGLLQTDEGTNWHSEEMHKLLASKFFMGFITIIIFVAFRDKWCDYFKCDIDKTMEYFLDSLSKPYLVSDDLSEGNESLEK